MKLTNLEIYQIAGNYQANFINSNLIIPATANFYLQKNMSTIIAAAQEIDQYKLYIASSYGSQDPQTQQYIIAPEHKDKVTQELNDLFSLTQDLDIINISISAFKDVPISENQIKAIMFMIKD